MHKLVHNLTLCVLLYHLLVGCCWHHAHTADASTGHHAHSAMYIADSGTEHAGHHTCPADHGDHQDSGRHRQGCHEDHCVIVVPALEGGTRLLSHINLPTHSGVTHTAVVLAPPFQQARPSPLHTSLAPPLRLHLWNQILLI